MLVYRFAPRQDEPAAFGFARNAAVLSVTMTLLGLPSPAHAHRFSLFSDDGCCEFIYDDCVALPDHPILECRAGHVQVDCDSHCFGVGCICGGEGCRNDIATPDSDGDGLLDPWEVCGFDADADGAIDLDLPGFGSSPLHKDLFVELDWMTSQEPRQSELSRLTAAFAAAPINAGGSLNLDGQPGINLHVDTGNLTDPNGSEDGAGPSSCSDGIDNTLDGLVDLADPDCLAGKDLGGGNLIPPGNVSGLSRAFYAIKGINFNPNIRGKVFRYALSAQQPTNNAGTSSGNNSPNTLNDTTQGWLVNEWNGRTLTINGGTGAGQSRTLTANTRTQLTIQTAWMVIPDATSTYTISLTGGQGEKGGNDFVDYNHDAGSIMHELGHNLGLDHGGNVPANCKPNYVSVMNYDLAFGIPQVGGASVIDYSPPRFRRGRGAAPLPILRESALTEGIVLDATDRTNRFVYVDGMGRKVQSPLNGDIDGDGPGDGDGNGIGDGVDWNQDNVVPNASALMINIDTSSSAGNPAACTNAAANSTLTGFDDWSNVSLGFLKFGDSASGAVNRVIGPEPTLRELQDGRRAINSTDLAVTKRAIPDVPALGERFTFVVVTSNLGPNPASAVRFEDVLSAEGVYESDNAGCVRAAAGNLSCELGELLPGGVRSLEITVRSNGACVNGRPSPITNVGRVINAAEFAGQDGNVANNIATVRVTPIDDEPPSIVTPRNVGPIECTQPAGAAVTYSPPSVTDNCDLTPAVGCEPPPGSTFPIGTSPVICRATDASGNTANSGFTLTVVDSASPVILSAIARPNLLWPPNHRMMPVSLNVSVADVCDATPNCRIVSVSSNEPVDDGGGGSTAPDWIITGPLTLSVRAERSGRGSGRLYMITVQCTDNSENSSNMIVAVSVPHDRR